MKIIKTLERYWYIFLLIIITITLITYEEPTVTSEVILNLKHLDSSYYKLENPSNIKINTTISTDNEITGTIILHPNTSIILTKQNFTAIGEEYE